MPMPQQLGLLQALSAFVVAPGSRGVFLLNGYAGTGKTSIVGAMLRALTELHRQVVVLAPTGRAAKVAQSFSGMPASTIHKRIFRGNGADPGETRFYLAPNNCHDTIFFVDEASMISDSTVAGRSLLMSLVTHVYNGQNCAMVLIGDEAQLPPVGLAESPAMNPERLKAIGLDPVCYTLDIPARQAEGSGIVRNATIFRHFLFNPEPHFAPSIQVRDYPEVMPVSSADLADMLSDSWAAVGNEETLLITRSNIRSNNYNRAIRSQVMYADEVLQRGDRLVVCKNDYFWSKQNKLKTFIANGDTVEVTWLGKREKMYGRYFQDAEVRMADSTLVNVKIMLRSLNAEGPSLGRDEMQRFYTRVLDACDGSLSEKIQFALGDPFYNALQVKYAYAVTCHKAQGGQWRHVYIDMGGIDPHELTPEFYRWFYTAITRATERVFLINPTLPLE